MESEFEQPNKPLTKAELLEANKELRKENARLKRCLEVSVRDFMVAVKKLKKATRERS